MRRETKIDQRELSGFWIVHRRLPPGTLKWEDPCGRLIRSGLAEIRIFSRTDSRGEPNPAMGVEHWVVNIGLAVPDGLLSPIGRGRQDRIIGGIGSFRVAHRKFDLALRIFHRI